MAFTSSKMPPFKPISFSHSPGPGPRNSSAVECSSGVVFTAVPLEYFRPRGSRRYILRRIQKVQNSAAKLVIESGRRDHVQPLLQAFHWLPVKVRVDYKLSTIC